VGEVDVNLNTLVNGTTGDNTVFDEDSDDAPEIMIKNQPAPGASTTRNLEREMSGAERVRPDHRRAGADHRQHRRSAGAADPAHDQC
jgi:hypothetical protein